MPTVHVNEINEVQGTANNQTTVGTGSTVGTTGGSTSYESTGSEENTDPESEISGIENDLGELNALLGG